MSTQYTPKWKDDKGNVVIFPAPNTLFDSHADAFDWQVNAFLWMVAFGLSTAGILEINADDGKARIPHVAANLGKLGECAIIAGPMFDQVESP